MAKHKPICMIVTLLVVIGAVNWGLIGLGGFIGRDLNVVQMILGSIPQLLWVVYILVGVAGIATAYFAMKCKNCACEDMEMKK